ncbi:MAG: SpoIIE family protein phosphatase [Bacteroidetes bacterium]|nr:SpoIIE family protein phosphatase [Bacteroidota bacterium]
MVEFDIQEQILEKLNALVVVLNSSGNAEYVSKSACQLLGYDNNELIGSNWWDITRFSKPEGERTKNKILAVMRRSSASVETFEHLLKTSYGGQKWIRWNVSYLNEEQIIGIGYDVTDKKQQEKQLLDRNVQLLQQHKEIKDSIFYAQRIQQNSLQSKEYINSVFNHNFVLYKPKDIVSGDFYFFYQDNDNRYAFVVDCTGHGVPGAMMSMVANSIIKEVLLNKKAKAVSQILYELDKELFKCINSYGTELSSDGMDVAIISISKKTNRLHFAGAFRPMIIVRKEQIIELKASRYPLGFYNDVDKIFEEHVILLQPGDNLYLFTDGFLDQFGGENNKKLNRRNFKEMLKIASEMPLEEQESFLDYSFNNWKQEEEQTDDVLVVGIKI